MQLLRQLLKRVKAMLPKRASRPGESWANPVVVKTNYPDELGI